MASHGFDPGNPNIWYQSPHLGLIPTGYGGKIAGNCYNHSLVGASYHPVTNFTPPLYSNTPLLHFTHPNCYLPPHHFTPPSPYPPPLHFTQPNPYPPPQNFSQPNYPPPQLTQPNSYPPPQNNHSATLINGHWLPPRFPCVSHTHTQDYPSPHLQSTHSIAPQPLTTTTQIPSIPSYYIPHPNPNLQIQPPISPNSSVEPLAVHSHLWRARCKQVALQSTAATRGVKKPSRFRLGTVLPRKTGNSQKRYQLLMRKPKFQRLLGAITQDVKTGLRLHGSYVEQPETLVKLKGSGKLPSPKRGSSEVSHKERTNDKLREMRESLKRSMDTFMLEFKEELRLLMGSWQSLARRVDNPQKFVSLPQSSTPELILATTGGSSSLISANDGSQVDMCLKFGSLPPTSVDLIAATIDGNPVRISTNTGLNLWQPEVGFNSEISTEPVASDISTTSAGEILSLNNDMNVVVVSGSNCQDGISTCMTDKLNPVSNMMGASIGSREYAFQSTEGLVVTVKLIGTLQDDRELKETKSVTAKHDEMTSEYGRDDEVDPPDKEHTDRFDGSENDVKQPVFNENLNMPQSTHFSRGTVVSSYMHDLETSRQLDVCSHKSSMIPKDLDSKEAIKIVNEHIKDCTRPPDDFQVDDLCATYRIFFEFLITFSASNMEKELPVNFHEFCMKLRCLAAAQDKLKEAGVSDMIGENLQLLWLLLFSNIMTTLPLFIKGVMALGMSTELKCALLSRGSKSACVNECLIVPGETIVTRLVCHLGEELHITISYTHVGHYTMCWRHTEVILVEKSHLWASCQVAFDYGLTIILQNANEEFHVYSTLYGLPLLNYDILHGVVWSKYWPLDYILEQALMVIEHGPIHSVFKVPCQSTTMQPKIDEYMVQYVGGTISSWGFEADISKHGQAGEHTMFAFTFGDKQIICCCNKISWDAVLCCNFQNEINMEVKHIFNSIQEVVVCWNYMIAGLSLNSKHELQLTKYGYVHDVLVEFHDQMSSHYKSKIMKYLKEHLKSSNELLLSVCMIQLSLVEFAYQTKSVVTLSTSFMDELYNTGIAFNHIATSMQSVSIGDGSILVLLQVVWLMLEILFKSEHKENALTSLELLLANIRFMKEPCKQLFDKILNQRVDYKDMIAFGATTQGHMLHDKVLDLSTHSDDHLDVLYYDMRNNSLAALLYIEADSVGILNTSAAASNNVMAFQLVNIIGCALRTSVWIYLNFSSLCISVSNVMSTIAAVLALFDKVMPKDHRYTNDLPSSSNAKVTHTSDQFPQYNVSCGTYGRVFSRSFRLEGKPVL